VANSLTVAPAGASTNSKSSAIILTSKKLACTAFVAKAINGGGDAEPAYPLTVIAKTKQKAAN
jgi:hypothetical protein